MYESLSARSALRHLLWITGIDLSDPDNPVVILNDSYSTGRHSGAGVRYPLDVFLSAWEDSEFSYAVIGDKIEETGATRKKAEDIGKTTRDNTTLLRKDGYVMSVISEEQEQAVIAEIDEKTVEKTRSKISVRSYINEQLKHPKTFLEFIGRHSGVGNLIITDMQRNMSADEYNQWAADVKSWVTETNAEYESIKEKYNVDPATLDAIVDTLVNE